MPKIQPYSLKHRELLKKLKEFDITEVSCKGKGSERMLVLKSGLASKYKGPQIPIKFHGEGTEHSVRVIDSVLRRFNIDPEKFWKYAQFRGHPRGDTSRFYLKEFWSRSSNWTQRKKSGQRLIPLLQIPVLSVMLQWPGHS